MEGDILSNEKIKTTRKKKTRKQPKVDWIAYYAPLVKNNFLRVELNFTELYGRAGKLKLELPDSCAIFINYYGLRAYAH